MTRLTNTCKFILIFALFQLLLVFLNFYPYPRGKKKDLILTRDNINENDYGNYIEHPDDIDEEIIIKDYISQWAKKENVTITPHYGRYFLNKYKNVVFHTGNGEYIVYNGKEFKSTNNLDTIGNNTEEWFHILDSIDPINSIEDLLLFDFYSYRLLPPHIAANDKYYYYKTLFKSSNNDIDSSNIHSDSSLSPSSNIGVIYITDNHAQIILDPKGAATNRKEFGLDISILQPQLLPDPSLFTTYHDFIYKHAYFKNLLYNNILYDLQQHMTLQMNTLEQEDYPDYIILNFDEFSLIRPYYPLIVSRFTSDYSPIPGFITINLRFLNHLVLKECYEKMEDPQTCRILSLLHIYLIDIIRINEDVTLLLPINTQSLYISQVRALMS